MPTSSSVFVYPCQLEKSERQERKLRKAEDAGWSDTCENLDDPQHGHVFENNTCMCNGTQPPYRLLGGAGLGESTVPRSRNNTFLTGSGDAWETVTFGCCNADCDSVEAEGAPEAAVGTCPDGLPGSVPKTKTDCPAGAHCKTCRDGPNVEADDCIVCDEGFVHTPAIPGGEPDCTGWCRKRNCTMPPASTKCPQGAHCATCKAGASTDSDCLTCGAGFRFKDGIPGGEPDCTGDCVPAGPSPPSPSPSGSWCNPNSTAQMPGFTLAQWQAKGQEAGTVMGPMPQHAHILGRARGLLRWEPHG